MLLLLQSARRFLTYIQLLLTFLQAANDDVKEKLQDAEKQCQTLKAKLSAAQAELLTLSNRLADHILFNETLQRRNGLLKRSLVQDLC